MLLHALPRVPSSELTAKRSDAHQSSVGFHQFFVLFATLSQVSCACTALCTYCPFVCRMPRCCFMGCLNHRCNLLDILDCDSFWTDWCAVWPIKIHYYNTALGRTFCSVFINPQNCLGNATDSFWHAQISAHPCNRNHFQSVKHFFPLAYDYSWFRNSRPANIISL